MSTAAATFLVWLDGWMGTTTAHLARRGYAMRFDDRRLEAVRTLVELGLVTCLQAPRFGPDWTYVAFSEDYGPGDLTAARWVLL